MVIWIWQLFWDFGDADQCDQIGRNFAVEATFYLAYFHTIKQFQPVVCWKVSKVF
jgi:hypothetical protein